MIKVRDLIFFQEPSLLDACIHEMQMLPANIKLLICDVIPDYHLIGERRNRTISPQERIFPSKLIECSVIWYLYITDEKGERYNPAAWVIIYRCINEAELMIIKLSNSFVM